MLLSPIERGFEANDLASLISAWGRYRRHQLALSIGLPSPKLVSALAEAADSQLAGEGYFQPWQKPELKGLRRRSFKLNCLRCLVRPAGIEPATTSLEGLLRKPAQLSLEGEVYKRKIDLN